MKRNVLNKAVAGLACSGSERVIQISGGV